MTKLRVLIALAAAALSLTSAPAAAENFSYTGTLADPNQVLLFNFNVGSSSEVTLRTYSYAGGTNAAGTVIARGGFDPILALFGSTGALIVENDDGGSDVPADPLTGNEYDTFLRALLAPGSYTVSVQAFSNFANGPNLSDGFENDGTFNGRSNFFAFDILNVDTATQVGAVPEPATWAMMLLGFGAIGVGFRRSRRQQIASLQAA
jgi:hypothetical protein